ncbi:MAG: UDP-3-O-(3-hydroxymyristoyl)glucosamine N-acyltransferase [Alphaproteobacteria bacterium]|nr:UDP-3-O-(3-hydroxymyristoyl)glucosamine N-acyltransferase [Alphaproteobacteria bacterium]
MTESDLNSGLNLLALADHCQCQIKTHQQPNYAPETIFIKQVAALNQAGTQCIAFFGDVAHLPQAQTSRAAAIITSEKLAGHLSEFAGILLISPAPRLAFVQAALLLHPEPVLTPRLATTAVIAATAKIGQNCCIDDGAVIGENVQIGDESWIGANSVIADGVIIGKNARIHPNCSISHAKIGDDFTLFPNSMIGRPGFGFVDRRQLPRSTSERDKTPAPTPGPTPGPIPGLTRIPQIGGVLIGHQVEIGANSTVDRATLGDTIIGNGCKIDNGVQIAHNCRLGHMCILAGHVGLAGSVTLGDGAILGGAVVVSDHLTIGAGAQIAIGSLVTSDVPPQAKMGGHPAMALRQWHRLNLKLAQFLTKGGLSDS